MHISGMKAYSQTLKNNNKEELPVLKAGKPKESIFTSLTSWRGSIIAPKSPLTISIPDFPISLSAKSDVRSVLHEWLNVSGTPIWGGALRGGDPDNSGFEWRKKEFPDDEFICHKNE